jgi:hypothetical protein
MPLYLDVTCDTCQPTTISRRLWVTWTKLEEFPTSAWPVEPPDARKGCSIAILLPVFILLVQPLHGVLSRAPPIAAKVTFPGEVQIWHLYIMLPGYVQ